MIKIPIENFHEVFLKDQAMRLRRLKKECEKNPCHSEAKQDKNMQELNKKYGRDK